MRKSYCVECRKQEKAREAAAKAEEEQREEEARQHIKGKCDRCGKTGTHLHFCDYCGTFKAITVKGKDNHIESLDCESMDLAIIPKKIMLVKCTKCCEF